MTFDGQWSVTSGQWRTHAEQRAAAVRLLGELLGSEVSVEHTVQGAPYLPSRPDLYISISHCRTAVAVAVNDKSPVGIDIECRRRVSDSLMARICTPEEHEEIHRSDDPVMAFLRYWTQKEAVLKCRGTGIRGFGSMVDALQQADMEVWNLPCELPDTVVALAILS